MHRLDPTTTLLTAALALATALALSAETPLVGGYGDSRGTSRPSLLQTLTPETTARWVALNAREAPLVLRPDAMVTGR